MATILNFENTDRPLNNEEKAQDLVWDAWEAETPEKSIGLAKKALKLNPNCTDAFNILARHETCEMEKMVYYLKAIQAFKNSNDEQFFKDSAGCFWGILETRPYMRALLGYGICHWDNGNRDEAVRIFQEMLDLNPNDNQGVRFLLVSWFLILGKYDEANNLIKRYDGFGVALGYGALLLNIIKKKGKAAVNKAYREAKNYNPYVIPYILKKKRFPKNLPGHFALGSKDEAVSYMLGEYGKELWKLYPLAVQTLAELSENEE